MLRYERPTENGSNKMNEKNKMEERKRKEIEHKSANRKKIFSKQREKTRKIDRKDSKKPSIDGQRKIQFLKR